MIYGHIIPNYQNNIIYTPNIVQYPSPYIYQTQVPNTILNPINTLHSNNPNNIPQIKHHYIIILMVFIIQILT